MPIFTQTFAGQLFTALVIGMVLGWLVWAAVRSHRRSIDDMERRMAVMKEELRRQHRQELEEFKKKLLAEAFGGIAHKITQPMTAMTLKLEILKKTVHDETILSQIGEMETYVSRLRRLISRMQNINPDTASTRYLDEDSSILEIDSDID